MSTLVRILLAIVVGVIVTSLLEYFGALNHGLDVLLGVLAALIVFFAPLDGRPNPL